jgi:hypothetical protein
MAVNTLKKATEDLGVSFDDVVNYYIKENKGIIEVNLTATDNDIEQSTVNDASEDFLSEEELNYYLRLKEI